MKDEIKDKISEKQDELIKIYEDYVIGNEIEGFEWERDFQKPANTLINELASLKSQLAEAGEEKKSYDIEKSCLSCKFFEILCTDEACESCYPIAYSNWQPR